jgi:hypothetical protein
MVSTTLVSPNIIKPKLRRSIPFGAPYVYAYRYEKLIHDSQSLIGSIGSCDSIRGSSGAFRDVDVPIADESTSYGSISSILFSVDKQSMTSDECSYSFSLSSNSFLSEGYFPLTSVIDQARQDSAIDISHNTYWSFDGRFMSRHAGLDYKGRFFSHATSTSARGVTSHDDLPYQSLQTAHEDLSGYIRATTKDYCETNVATALFNQLETTLNSESDDFSTSTQYDFMVKLLPPKKGKAVTNGRKVARVRRWLRKLNPSSALVRSLISPAA